MSSNLFIFLKTSYTTYSPTAFKNHVISWCKKNNVDYDSISYENYVLQYGVTLCPHCGIETKFNGFMKGFDKVCKTVDCYKTFVENNLDYYESVLHAPQYTDPYDGILYKRSFSKIYYAKTKTIYDRQITKNCIVCNELFAPKDHNSVTCSNECRYKQIGITRKKTITKSHVSNYGQLFEDFDLTNDDHVRKANHLIYEAGSTKCLPCFIRGKHILLANPSRRFHYYSKEFDLHFYKASKNSLYLHLNNDESYEEYHKKHHYDLCFRQCLACKKDIFHKDVFGRVFHHGKYCCHECYYEGVRLGQRAPASPEHRLKMSNTMKEKIASGEFTPCVTNTWTHNRIEVDGVKYRSSWDAAFGVLNTNYEYEKLRIPYVFDGETRTYIVDYVNHIDKIAIEIKPSGMSDTSTVCAKRDALVYFCDKNGYNYIEVDEHWFKDFVDDDKIRLLKQKLESAIFDKFLNGVGIYYENFESDGDS